VYAPTLPRRPRFPCGAQVSGSAAQLARAGDSCEVVLVAAHGHGHGGALEPGSVPPGAVLCAADFPAALVTRCVAQTSVAHGTAGTTARRCD
jgi:elongation factor 1 alpha-like protein